MNRKEQMMIWQYGLLTAFFLLIVANNMEHPVLKQWAIVLGCITFLMQITTILFAIFSKRIAKKDMEGK